ncbi:uncharacterized protein Pyn_12677 [Prunus yedoensis var. nudiflora]|uniref:F-box protein n=1 Tax=Prunus yedoensis var. nudiflora TaxID=2094558 RepID=A0A314ZDI4_PRUYE|nr:uncharacterized protein Pyn_12677 [Prunus yedoensis var. nudiflora]
MDEKVHLDGFEHAKKMQEDEKENNEEVDHEKEKKNDGGLERIVKSEITCQAVLEDILFRLSVKSILRFQVVSKRWLSLTRTPGFRKLHNQRLGLWTRPKFHLLLTAVSEYRPEVVFCRIEVDPVENTAQADEIMTVPHNLVGGRVEDRGTDHGLVRFYSQAVNCFVCSFGSNEVSYRVDIVNPYTRTLITLPEGPPLYELFNGPWEREFMLSDSHKRNEIAFHFGYDPHHQQYKVLQVQWAFERLWARPISRKMRVLEEVLEFKLAIFTLGSKEWRDITNSANLPLDPQTSYDFLSNIFNRTLFVNGSFYWHHKITSYFRPPKSKILAFDVGMERFTLITPPDNIGTGINLVEVDGCAAVLAKDIHRQAKMWILRSTENIVWEIKEIDYINGWRSTEVGLKERIHMTALFEVTQTEIMLTMVHLDFPIGFEELLSLKLLDVPARTVRLIKVALPPRLRFHHQEHFISPTFGGTSFLRFHEDTGDFLVNGA